MEYFTQRRVEILILFSLKTLNNIKNYCYDSIELYFHLKHLIILFFYDKKNIINHYFFQFKIINLFHYFIFYVKNINLKYLLLKYLLNNP
jgi:hypothetical protein